LITGAKQVEKDAKDLEEWRKKGLSAFGKNKW